ncbi:competence/damage-inducible protein A [Cellulosilyticum sp. I15G10I2]|uniref:competence/damage-inducible protein A n=1 Tax=Cellulosilyticum sp. I15G10I2 TaxID=1892843 RepID=UPI00085BB3FA|nr:competence/damage-inducible protein A [Cellulosilyticum sp. I15G10I2]
MKAEIIAIGNEIVTGNTVNSNASYIAKQIQTLGIIPKYHSAVCDTMQDIQEVLSKSLEHADMVFVTGGLGPTDDDLTKEAICGYLGMELVIKEDICQNIQAFFNKIGRYMPECNKKQAAFPRDAYILENKNGTAPGCILTKDKKHIILLPGPPKEMKPMLDGYVLPYFKEKLNCAYHTIDIKLFGIGESEMAERIAHLLGETEYVSVAPYVGDYEVIVRITAYGSNEKQAIETTEKIKNSVCECLGEYVIGYNQDTLENVILELMKKHQYTIATVESCTGGMIASTLVNCSGISAYFKEGFITYSNEAKKKYAGVLEETLITYGAVSEQTAKEMAEGIRLRTKADIGLSATGIAGPDGGTSEKPVGRVYIGIAFPDRTYVYELNLNGTRQVIREKTVKNLLFQLYRNLK